MSGRLTKPPPTTTGAGTPRGVTHLNPAIDGNTIWFAGGFKKHPGPVTSEVWKYEIAADTWTAGPPAALWGCAGRPGDRLNGEFALLWRPDCGTNSSDHLEFIARRRKPGNAKRICPFRADGPPPDGKIYALG